MLLSDLQTADNYHKQIKKLRHPHILAYVDGVEQDQELYIATEPVTPLSA